MLTCQSIFDMVAVLVSFFFRLRKAQMPKPSKDIAVRTPPVAASGANRLWFDVSPLRETYKRRINDKELEEEIPVTVP
jgi:hypothetical protein